MTDKYPRVSKVQLELWLESPVTKAVLLGYEEIVKKVDERMRGEYFMDPANNDLSMNEYHRALGVKQGIGNASKFTEVLSMCSLIEVDK